VPDTTDRLRENKPIKVLRAIHDDQAAADGSIRLLRPHQHVSYRDAIHCVCITGSIHREARREHFGKNDQVGCRLDIVKHNGELCEVRLWVVPGKIGLYDCYSQS
jgi:hypothetical protein